MNPDLTELYYNKNNQIPYNFTTEVIELWIFLFCSCSFKYPSQYLNRTYTYDTP